MLFRYFTKLNLKKLNLGKWPKGQTIANATNWHFDPAGCCLAWQFGLLPCMEGAPVFYAGSQLKFILWKSCPDSHHIPHSQRSKLKLTMFPRGADNNVLWFIHHFCPSLLPVSLWQWCGGSPDSLDTNSDSSYWTAALANYSSPSRDEIFTEIVLWPCFSSYSLAMLTCACTASDGQQMGWSQAPSVHASHHQCLSALEKNCTNHVHHSGKHAKCSLCHNQAISTT